MFAYGTAVVATGIVMSVGVGSLFYWMKTAIKCTMHKYDEESRCQIKCILKSRRLKVRERGWPKLIDQYFAS